MTFWPRSLLSPGWLWRIRLGGSDVGAYGFSAPEWPETVSVVKAALGDVHPEVRAAAISKAGLLQAAELAPEVASHLGAEFWGERWSACWALYELGSLSPAVTDTLLALLDDPEAAKRDATTLRIRRAEMKHNVFDPERMCPTTAELLRLVQFAR